MSPTASRVSDVHDVAGPDRGASPSARHDQPAAPVDRRRPAGERLAARAGRRGRPARRSTHAEAYDAASRAAAASPPSCQASYASQRLSRTRPSSVGPVGRRARDASEGRRLGDRQLVGGHADVDARCRPPRPDRSASRPARPGSRRPCARRRARRWATSARRRTRRRAAPCDGVARQQRQPGPGGRGHGRAAAAPRRSAPSAAASPRSGPAGRGPRSGARRRRPGPPAPPARARSATSALVEPASSTTSTGWSGDARVGVEGWAGGRRSWHYIGRQSARGRDRRERTAQPGEGTDVPEDIDIHTTAGKLADLERRLDEAVHAGSAKAVEKQHAKGRKTARERIEHALRRGLVRRARRAGPAPVDRVRPGEEAPLRRRRGHRLRHHRRPPGVRVLPGLHGLRRLAGRGLRREDHQGHGPRDQDRLPDHRHQRGRRRPHPGGRGLARPVRRDLPPQRARLAASSRRSA